MNQSCCLFLHSHWVGTFGNRQSGSALKGWWSQTSKVTFRHDTWFWYSNQGRYHLLQQQHLATQSRGPHARKYFGARGVGETTPCHHSNK